MPPSSQTHTANEENAKRLVRKAAKLQQRQLMHLLAPFLVKNPNDSTASASTSPLPPSASSSGDGSTSNDVMKGAMAKEQQKKDGFEMIRLCTTDGEPLQLDCQWGTRLDQDDTDWIFQLFRRNMRQLYLKSQWGYDECIKLQELQATTARFIILRNTQRRAVAYAHFRFVDDFTRPVVYCYEVQVEKDYQQKGVGTLLIRLLQALGNSVQMEALMCTVFAFNGPSLAFFYKMGFRSDRTCMFGKECDKQCQGPDFVILYKSINGDEQEEAEEEPAKESIGKCEGGEGQHKNANKDGTSKRATGTAKKGKKKNGQV